MSEDKYTLKISKDLSLIFQKYIDENKQLGYRSVSEYLHEIIRNEAKKILEQKK
jgi:hypothetical protein